MEDGVHAFLLWSADDVMRVREARCLCLSASSVKSNGAVVPMAEPCGEKGSIDPYDFYKNMYLAYVS